MDVVLYTDASPPRPVNTWLDRHHRALCQRGLSGAGKTGCLMHFQTQAMAQAVAEELPVSAALNVAPGKRVGSHAGHPRPDRMRRDVIGVPYDLVYVPLFRGGNSHDEST